MNRLSIGYDERSTWSLDGEAVGPTRTFGSLPDALACARELTNAAEALIELRISGIYACVHQEPGWPHRIVKTPVRSAA
jgi:hypothetical protein